MLSSGWACPGTRGAARRRRSRAGQRRPCAQGRHCWERPAEFGCIFRSIEVSIPACHAGDPGSIPGGRDLFHVFQSAQTYPSGYGARLLSECALHAQVRTLPSAIFALDDETVSAPCAVPGGKHASVLQSALYCPHTFSAFWLRSSVVSVLISLITYTMSLTLKIILMFLWR